MKKNNERKGFTLIELLVTISIISVVFVVGFVVVSNLVNSSNKIVDNATKNAIINAAELYAIEFRSSSDWEEEIKKIENSENTSFCVSVDSLINYGYFKDDDNKLKEFRENNVVKIVINNGVYNYEIIGRDDDDSKSCMYFEYETNIVSGSEGVVEINEISTDDGASTINYQLLKQDDEKILLNLNGDIKFKVDKLIDIIPTYIVLVIDDSLSMWCENSTRKDELTYPVCHLDGGVDVTYDNYESFFNTVDGKKFYEETNYAKAVKASNDFLESIRDAIPKAKVAGVKYHKYISYNSGFVSASEFQGKIDFGYGSFGNTNTGAGLDAASTLLYFEEKNKSVESLDNAFIYTVLLFDGYSNFYSRFKPSDTRDKLFPDEYRANLGENDPNANGFLTSTNIVNNMNSDSLKDYFENYFDKISADNLDDSYGNIVNLGYCAKNSSLANYNQVHCENSVVNSAKILKDTFNSKLFYIAYNISADSTEIKKIATKDDKLCLNSDFVDESGNKYCYYEADADNVSTLMSLIAEDVSGARKSTKINKLELIITPNSDVFSKILKDGEEIDSINKVIDLNDGILNPNEIIEFVENYELVLKEKNQLFKNCNFIEGTCNEGFKLFDIKVVLNSDIAADGSFEYYIENNSEITLNTKKVITLN